MPYFFKYYDKTVDRYIIYDDGSTDRSLEILREHPKVEVRSLPRLNDNDSYVLAAQVVHDSCWKESRGEADWVIITAIDEFLFVPNLKDYLSKCKSKNITAIPALGHQMLSETRPIEDRPLTDMVRRGCPFEKMSKLSIFDPNKIYNMNHSVGRHFSEPTGEVRYPKKDELLNLHYKYVGFEETFQRHEELNEKLGSYDKGQNWGFRYRFSREQLREDWDNFEKNATDVFAPNYDAVKHYSQLAERWWRPAAVKV